MVFEQLPTYFLMRPVIDGDKYDMRYVDPKGVIIGLKFKKVRNKIDTSNNRFIIPKTDRFLVFKGDK